MNAGSKNKKNQSHQLGTANRFHDLIFLIYTAKLEAELFPYSVCSILPTCPQNNSFLGERATLHGDLEADKRHRCSMPWRNLSSREPAGLLATGGYSPLSFTLLRCLVPPASRSANGWSLLIDDEATSLNLAISSCHGFTLPLHIVH